MRLSIHERPLGRVQQLRAAGRADRRRPVGISDIRALVPGGAIGRGTSAGLDPDWMAQRVNVMRWVLRMKREANAAQIDAALAATGERAIVEVSTRDPWWGAKPAGDSYRGQNVLGRLWMELRQLLRDGDPAARAAAWAGRIRVGRLANAR